MRLNSLIIRIKEYNVIEINYINLLTFLIHFIVVDEINDPEDEISPLNILEVELQNENTDEQINDDVNGKKELFINY